MYYILIIYIYIYYEQLPVQFYIRWYEDTKKISTILALLSASVQNGKKIELVFKIEFVLASFIVINKRNCLVVYIKIYT